MSPNLDDLSLLALKYKTDKWGLHWYTRHYNHHFQRKRNSSFNMLEIGVGGYDDPQRGGESLRMWAEYFPHSRIVGLDFYDKSPHAGGRIHTVQGDQSDEATLLKLNEKYGPFDIIVDDGSHLNNQIIESFNYLFPLLLDDGVYAVEDTQTSYWPSHGGHPRDFNSKTTAVGYLKALADGINYKDIPDPDFKPSYFAQNIVGLHFYHSLVIVDKAPNTEESTAIRNNMPTHQTGGL